MAIRLHDRIEANIRQSDKVNHSLYLKFPNQDEIRYNGSETTWLSFSATNINAVSRDGDYMTGDLKFLAGSNDRYINFLSAENNTSNWRIGYQGSGSGDSNYFVIQSSQSTIDTWTNVLRLGCVTLDAYFTSKLYSEGGHLVLNANNYGDYVHLKTWDFSTQHSNGHVTFDVSAPEGGPGSWINGFVSTHNSYLSSYIVNKHRTSDWYVGYSEWRETNTVMPTWHKLLHSGNYTDYTVTKTGSGASGTWGISITGDANAANYIKIVRQNEICFQDFNYNTIWLNYAKPDGTAASTACTEYYFGNGQKTYLGVGLNAGHLTLFDTSYGAQLQVNNITTYGNLLLTGTKNGYGGIHFGDNANYMTAMSGDIHQGLYNNANSNWIIYYNRENGRIGLGTSNLEGYTVTVGGSLKATNLYGTLYGNASSATTLTSVLPVTLGGTGANNKKNAWANLIPYYDQPWSDVSQDTGNNWASLGNLTVSWWPSGNNGIYGKPSDWGLVLTVCASSSGSSEMHQLWFSQANGAIYHRGGNGSTATSMQANGWAKLWQVGDAVTGAVWN